MRTRARVLLPQVLLTLLSIVQALALELLWTRMTESDHLFPGAGAPDGAAVAALAGWLQFAAIALGIVLVWLVYVGLVLRFEWVPHTRDSIFPFAIGLLEFLAIEITGPAHPALWLAAMGVIFGVATYATNDVFVRALRESSLPFDEGASSAAADFRAALGLAGIHFLLAAVVWIDGGFGLLEAVVFAAVVAMILVQTWRVHGYLAGSLAEPDEPDEASADEAEGE